MSPRYYEPYYNNDFLLASLYQASKFDATTNTTNGPADTTPRTADDTEAAKGYCDYVVSHFQSETAKAKTARTIGHASTDAFKFNGSTKCTY